MYDGEYSDKVIDHFTNPRNVGEIENPSGVGTVGNAKCGDIMRIFLDIDDDGIIRDCKSRHSGAARPWPAAAWLPRWSRASRCRRPWR